MTFRGFLTLGTALLVGCSRNSDGKWIQSQRARPGSNHAEMIWVVGGDFHMGAYEDDQEALPREKPRHLVRVDGFYMDVHEVTNAQYAEFVEATGYVTVAERTVEMPNGVFDPGSMVFEPPEAVFGLRDHGQWWRWREAACWRSPEGPKTTWENRANHPVVHVSYEDAVAYAEWRNCRLPTEAEWEYAATSGGEGMRFPWGNVPPDVGEVKCNIWDGVFPTVNDARDGHVGSAPVMTYAPNRLGLWDLGGNVWELCADWYAPGTYASMESDQDSCNPRGPSKSFDPLEPEVPKKVMRGGSFLCNAGYCSSYRVTARMPVAFDTGTSHIGFRCVRDSATFNGKE